MRFLILAALSLTVSQAAFSYTCSKSCERQCKFTVFGSEQTNWVKVAACQGWRAINCINYANPGTEAIRAAGAAAYPAGAQAMKARNIHFEGLNALEKKVLRPFFGDIVDKVKLHFGAAIDFSLGVPPLQIEASKAGMTFGYDVYIRQQAATLRNSNPIYWIRLLGHELMHTKQFVSRGESFVRFGRDYFEAHFLEGFSENPMEAEAHAMEDAFEDAWNKVTQGLVYDLYGSCFHNHLPFDVVFLTKWTDQAQWQQVNLKANEWVHVSRSLMYVDWQYGSVPKDTNTALLEVFFAAGTAGGSAEKVRKRYTTRVHPMKSPVNCNVEPIHNRFYLNPGSTDSFNLFFTY